MPDFHHRTEFARHLRAAREALGLSRRQLALLSGVNERSIVNYELGVNEPPLGQAARLAHALNSSLDALVDGSFQPAPGDDARDLLSESIRLQQAALLHLDDQRND